jgi:DNA topoisomerase III
MDKHGIGTDATIHEHIKTVQERGYAHSDNHFIKPTPIGIALVESFQQIRIDLHKPFLRARMERDMQMIADGVNPMEETRTQCIDSMKQIYTKTVTFQNKVQEVFAKHLNKCEPVQET